MRLVRAGGSQGGRPFSVVACRFLLGTSEPERLPRWQAILQCEASQGVEDMLKDPEPVLQNILKRKSASRGSATFRSREYR